MVRASAPCLANTRGFASAIIANDGGVKSGGYVYWSTISPTKINSAIESALFETQSSVATA